ncbi:DUF309 domain-containing protein [Pseudopelagicola sp. nBUS_19]|uniref:DUF309 domain-containing protein n=1 Tax=Pseudopelagicola sp. nBUS_19 TaxID=3395316 RepID=UPI003EC0E410
MTWRPPHAYVPGHNARHTEGLFDQFGFDARNIASSERWKLAIACLQEGYFWEAHELFEPIWLACPAGSLEKRLTQGLIQLANAALKRRMQRPNAVQRLQQLARELLTFDYHESMILGLNEEAVAQLWLDAFDEKMV